MIAGFERFIGGYPLGGFYKAEYVVGRVFNGALTQAAVGDDVESQLVLKALRRSTDALSHATENQLGDYLRELSPEGVKGVGTNAKGVCHEMLFTRNYNDSHVHTYAEMFAETNHPGADIQINSVADNSLNDRAWDSFLLAAGVASLRYSFSTTKQVLDIHNGIDTFAKKINSLAIEVWTT